MTIRYVRWSYSPREAPECRWEPNAGSTMKQPGSCSSRDEGARRIRKAARITGEKARAEGPSELPEVHVPPLNLHPSFQAALTPRRGVSKKLSGFHDRGSCERDDVPLGTPWNAGNSLPGDVTARLMGRSTLGSALRGRTARALFHRTMLHHDRRQCRDHSENET